MSRTGTISGSTISWGAAVSMGVSPFGTNANLYPSFVKVNTKVYLGLGIDASPDGDVYIFSTSNLGSTWTQEAHPVAGSPNGVPYVPTISRYGASNIIVAYAHWSSSEWNYVTSAGDGTWSTVSSTSGSGLPASTHKDYRWGSAFDGVNNCALIGYVPTSGGGTEKIWKFCSPASQTFTDLTTGTNEYSTMSNLCGNIIKIIYRRAGVIYSKEYNANTGTWGLETTPFGTTFTSPAYLKMQRPAGNGAIGVSWQEGSVSPFNVRFDKFSSTCADTPPTFTSVSASPNPVKGGNTETITTVASDSDGDTIKLFVCKASDATSAGCGAGGTWCSTGLVASNPSCSFASPVTDASNSYSAYIFDNNNAGAANNPLTGTFTTDSTPPTTSIASIDGYTTFPYFDFDGDNQSVIVVNGESGMACRWYTTDSAYDVTSGTACSISGTQATCTITPVNVSNNNTAHVSCADSLGNGQSASQNLDANWTVHLNFTIVSGACPSGFTCVLSLNQTNNTHVGKCGYFGLSLCTNVPSAAIRQNSCASGETAFIRLFQENNTHVGAVEVSNYGNISCLQANFNVITRASCNSPNEVCAVSINATNDSHVGQCGYYGNSVCTGFLRVIPPVITIQQPTNTTYVSTSVWANVTLDETGNVTFRSLDGGANVSLTNSSGNWNNLMSSLSQGSHNVKFYANDSLGNMGSSGLVFFAVDTIGPTIPIQQPTNTTYASTSVWVNVTLSETTGYCGRSLDSTANFTMTNSSGNWNNQMSSLSQGSHNVIVYCNDTLGNMGASSTTFFTVDTVGPTITVQQPANTTYSNTSVWANITLSETGTNVLRSLDGGSNVSLINSSGNWNNLMSGLLDGSHNVKFYAKDAVGNDATPVTIFFSVDTIGCYAISGKAYDYFTGLLINNGTAIATVKENGKTMSSNVTNGTYSLCIYTGISASKNSFTVGVVVNSTDGKSGWNTFVIGSGPFASQTQACSVRQLHFTGNAISTSGAISQGAVGATVNTEKGIFTNSTSFANGFWDIYISPCLISGGLYTFNFALSSSDGKSSTLSLQQVAR